MSWHVLISFQVVLVAFATILMRFLAKNKKTASSGLAITAGWFCVQYIVGLIILPYIGGANSNDWHSYWWRFVIGGFAFALNNILFYYMLVYLDAAIGTILGTMAALFTVLGASVLLHEYLSDLQIVATGLLIVSITYGVLATRHKKTKAAHRNLAIGFFLALLASFFYAVAAINEKALLDHITVGSYLLYGWAWQTIGAFCLVLAFKPRSLAILKEPKILAWTFILGLLRAVSGVCFILTLVKSNNVSLATVITNFRLILIILLGVWILKERKKLKQKFVAATGATISLVLLFWR